MNEIWQIVVTALGGYTIIFGGLFWWLGNRKLQSLLAKEKGDIQKTVNEENSVLIAKNQKELETLKARIATEESVRQMLTGTFSNAQSKVFERRLSYIEDLWKSFCCMRESIPAHLIYVDVITETEYQKWINQRGILGDLSMDKITDLGSSITGDIEKVRPFVGEYLWSLFFAYRAFSLRVVVVLFMEHQNDTPKYWKKDDGLRQILNSVLSENEYSVFITKEIGSIQYVQNLLDSKFIEQVENIISGNSSIQESAEQARTIMRKVQQVM